MTVVILNSCNKCRGDIEHFTFPEEMEKYFGVFQPGNYWVYYNQDSSKKDSMYISDFEEKKVTVNEELPPKSDCHSYNEKHFKLHTQYLTRGYNVHEVKYTFYCCDRWTFDTNISGQAPRPFEIIAKKTSNNSYVFNSSMDTISSLTINNTEFNDVLRYSAKYPFHTQNIESLVFFAPNIGIVQYFNGLDTFKISKYSL
ncbi:MAG: hypothetical protein WD048_16250 [Chitinophagales bacterium]